MRTQFYHNLEALCRANGTTPKNIIMQLFQTSEETACRTTHKWAEQTPVDHNIITTLCEHFQVSPERLMRYDCNFEIKTYLTGHMSESSALREQIRHADKLITREYNRIVVSILNVNQEKLWNTRMLGDQTDIALSILRSCDEIILMPNYRNSNRCLTELAWAKAHNMPIQYFKDNHLFDEEPPIWTKETFIKANQNRDPKANPDILGFIYDFNHSKSTDPCNLDYMRQTFAEKYCYYFAVMLKKVFEYTGNTNGDVCIMAPNGHFCYVDGNGIPYDINGVYHGEAPYYIPEKYMDDRIKDFLHIDSITPHNTSEKEIKKMICHYKNAVANGTEIDYAKIRYE